MSKLFRVCIEREIYVVANDNEAAEEIALHYEKDELYADPLFVNVEEATDLKRVHKDWCNSLPYGGEDDLTVKQILEQS